VDDPADGGAGPAVERKVLWPVLAGCGAIALLAGLALYLFVFFLKNKQP
jgi:hypothetical protein